LKRLTELRKVFFDAILAPILTEHSPDGRKNGEAGAGNKRQDRGKTEIHIGTMNMSTLERSQAKS